MPDQVNTELVKEGEKVDLQVRDRSSISGG
jgi:hypothetical protein